MTEHERDQRDLRILKQYDKGVVKMQLAKRHAVSRHYVDRLIRGALGE